MEIINRGLEILNAMALVYNASGKIVRTALVFSPHPDDSSYIGATIRLLVERGVRVVICVVTEGAEGFIGGPPKVNLRIDDEFVQEATVLGVTKNNKLNENTIILPREVPQKLMPEDRNLGTAGMVDGNIRPTKFLRDAISWVIRTVRPGVVMVPSINEAHHDHRNLNTAVREAYARRDSTSRKNILGLPHADYHLVEFETVSLSLGEEGLFYVLAEEEYWRKREEAMRCHKSQVLRDPEAYILRRRLMAWVRGAEAYRNAFKEEIQQELEKKYGMRSDEEDTAEEFKKKFEDAQSYSDFASFVEEFGIQQGNYPKAEAFRIV